jgi:hydrogenase small subunit
LNAQNLRGVYEGRVTIMNGSKYGPSMTRRGFLAAAGATGAAAFLFANAPRVAAAIESSSTKLAWLRGAGCGGCTASLLNGGNPEVLSALEKIRLDLAYHDGLMFQQGVFVDGSPAGNISNNSNLLLKSLESAGGYVLVLEGAVPDGPDGTGKYCMTGAAPFKQLFKDAASNASCIVAAGTCASYGGVSRSLSLTDSAGAAFSGAARGGALARYGIDKKVINVPGCPSHPDWLLLVLADVLAGREVDVDLYGRPVAFFGSPVHESCPRRGAFDRAARDSRFAAGGCLYGLGCKGPLAYADCPTRRWNDGTGTCTQSGGPCIACVEPGFPGDFQPFFRKAESRDILADMDVDVAARVVVGAAAIGAGIHAIKRLSIGESGREERGGKK